MQARQRAEDQSREVARGARLSKDLVVAEAVRLADHEGLHGLGMRRLARALDVGAMSLYHYVASRNELLDAMIDTVFAKIEPPSAEGDWQPAMRRWALSARQVLAAHPWAIALLDSRSTPGPAQLGHREAFTACLRRAGFTVLMATHANWLLDSYVHGFALQETALPFDTADQLTDTVEDVYLPQLPPEEFTYGLDLILAALDPLRNPN